MATRAIPVARLSLRRRRGRAIAGRCADAPLASPVIPLTPRPVAEMSFSAAAPCAARR
jgi:hypothetical protein